LKHKRQNLSNLTLKSKHAQQEMHGPKQTIINKNSKPKKIPLKEIQINHKKMNQPKNQKRAHAKELQDSIKDYKSSSTKKTKKTY